MSTSRRGWAWSSASGQEVSFYSLIRFEKGIGWLYELETENCFNNAKDGHLDCALIFNGVEEENCTIRGAQVVLEEVVVWRFLRDGNRQRMWPQWWRGPGQLFHAKEECLRGHPFIGI